MLREATDGRVFNHLAAPKHKMDCFCILNELWNDVLSVLTRTIVVAGRQKNDVLFPNVRRERPARHGS